jgi:hypothetical protein
MERVVAIPAGLWGEEVLSVGGCECVPCGKAEGGGGGTGGLVSYGGAGV